MYQNIKFTKMIIPYIELTVGWQSKLAFPSENSSKILHFLSRCLVAICLARHETGRVSSRPVSSRENGNST